ncbi:MAG: dUTP diphosphatase, partial [Elusimicrobiota bacterium]
MKIQVKKIRDVQLPDYAHPQDSGMDLINAGPPVTIDSGDRALIPSGIKVAVPENYEIQVRSRSGLAIKKGLFVLNSPGTVDAGYRGEIGVILFNTSGESVKIKHGRRIAQIVLQKIEKIEW